MLTMGPAVNDLAKRCAESAEAAEWESFLRLTTPYGALTAARVCRIWTGKAQANHIDDILQETYVKICEQERKILREFEPRGKDSFLALLRVVTASVANDYFRRICSAKRGGDALTISVEEVHEWKLAGRSDNAIQQSVLHAELDRMIRSAPNAFSERDRNLFWLYYLHGYTAEELAALPGLNLTPKGVESALRRITQWLKEEMKKAERPILLHSFSD